MGKTTLATAIGETTYQQAASAVAAKTDAPPASLVFVSRRQVSETSHYAAGLMAHLSVMLWNSGDEPDLSDAFWVPVQAAWFTAHSETVIGPLLAAGYDVIVDGWVYKFWSKLLVQGYTEPDLGIIFARVRMPDTVVLLDADLDALYDRPRQFRPAELGMHAGYGELGRHTFVDYQRRGRDHLVRFAEQWGWHTLTIGGDHPPASAAKIRQILATTPKSDNRR